MKIDAVGTAGIRIAAVACVAIAALVLAGCTSDDSSVKAAQAQVTSKEKAVTQAEAELKAASDKFCQSAETYITAIDRYGDVLNATAVTVGDVKVAGADLVKPRNNAFDDAQPAVDAQKQLVVAQQELADAQANLEKVKAKSTSTAVPSATAAPSASTTPTTAPLAPTASVERVKQAESEFSTAQDSVTDKTPLKIASEQFNSAAVALEMSWLQLFADAGCIPDDQKAQAQSAAKAYTTALQQDLTDAGYYTGKVDGVYGPSTVAAVEALQKANGLPVTGTVDKATSAALQNVLNGRAGAAAETSLASTAAIQQTLKLCGFWDGPVDGKWTPALTDAVKAFQKELGVPTTGTVDAATIAAFEKALDAVKFPPTPTPAPPSPSPSPTPTP